MPAPHVKRKRALAIKKKKEAAEAIEKAVPSFKGLQKAIAEKNKTAAAMQFGARSAPNCAPAAAWALILALTAF